jgi:hypothetical protein
LSIETGEEPSADKSAEGAEDSEGGPADCEGEGGPLSEDLLPCYQSKVPKDMKQSNMARTKGRNEGAFQMSRGTMGDFSNLDSQIVKITSIRIDNKTRTIL